MENQNDIQKPIEWQDDDNTLNFDYKVAEEGHSIIKVVGVGGGGSNAVRHMYEEGIQDVSFLIINTDKQALKGSPIPNKLQISEKGLGAGAKPEVAREDAIKYEEEIRNALSDGTEMVFITAGMGGGTGTGAAPVVAKIAHDLGILTVGIVTIPFKFEGREKIIMALEGVSAIKKHVDALLVVNNNRLIDIYPDFNFFNAFKKADDTLTIAAKSISDIINIEGYMNLDFADVSTTLRNGGVALISTGIANGEGRVSKAIKEAITSPLLQDNEITNAKHLLFELCFSETNPVSMAEIAELNNFVDGLSTDIQVIWGAMVDNSLGDDVKIIILASGFDMNSKGEVYAPALPKVAKHTVEQPAAEQPVSGQEPKAADDEVAKPVSEATATGAPKQEPAKSEPVKPEPVQTYVKPEEPKVEPKVEQKPEPVVAPKPVVEQPVAAEPKPEAPKAAETFEPIDPKPATSVLEGIKNISKFYGEETANKMRMDAVRKAYYVLNNNELSNEELVALIEQLPAYNRTAEELGQLKNYNK